MSWSIDGPKGFESDKIRYLLPKYTRGKVLEIGCGVRKAFPHFIGLDNGHHFGEHTAADVVGEADNLHMYADGELDAVFSSHVLEHMVDMGAALKEWGRVVKDGGYLCLYVPSANLYPKIGEVGCNPDHKHDIYPGDIERMLSDGWTVEISEERGMGNEYSILVIAQKGSYPERQKVGKTAFVVRLGGFGDLLQSALVLPALKAQGFLTIFMTTPKGQDILKHDPNVDEWYIVDTDQIPNHELPEFWKVQAARHSRFINLSESIEGYLLAMPGRVNHEWPDAVRRKRMNLNYHEWTADLAGVPFKPARLFYPSLEEVAEVKEVLEPGSFNVVWALSGSSLHKFYPHMDAVMARMMMEMPEARVFLVGDEACMLLEQGWEEEKRVIRLSGVLPIRKTLAMAMQADLVIGPETGVLNAAGMEKGPSKILFLSHSSENNLAKHWVNTQSLKPVNCSCYPCHRLHYGMEFCDQDATTMAARCAVNISPAVTYEAVEKVYKKWKRGQK